ncbi:MAG: hypothetical protein GTO14_21560, partial [Anaerolineales bacterium]|nr:hypothetical protein [Anaerolineales bacterium]
MFLKCPPWLNRCLTICIFFVASFEPSNFSALNPIRPQMFDDLPSGYPATSAQHQPLPSSNRVTASSLYPAPMLMSTSIRQLADFEFSQLSGGSSTDNYNESGLPASREKSILAVRNCPTPLSLMLHSSYGAQRMHELARQIIRSDLTTSTYRQILEDLKKGDCPDPNTIVVSLDDLGSSWLRPDFKSMIKAFTDRDLVLVVGVIVRGPQDPVIWAYLRGLEAQGIEVASHTIDHYNLPL